MKIERRYFDLYQTEWNEINEEVRREKEALTEADREIEKEKMSEELQEIYHKYEEHIRRWKRVPDEKSIQLFQKISTQALRMAKYICCNITVEDEKGTLGKIILEADSFTLPSLEDRTVNQLISNLFLTADDAFIGQTPAGLCKMEFWFQLYKEIPIN